MHSTIMVASKSFNAVMATLPQYLNCMCTAIRAKIHTAIHICTLCVLDIGLAISAASAHWCVGGMYVHWIHASAFSAAVHGISFAVALCCEVGDSVGMWDEFVHMSNEFSLEISVQPIGVDHLPMFEAEFDKGEEVGKKLCLVDEHRIVGFCVDEHDIIYFLRLYFNICMRYNTMGVSGVQCGIDD